MTAIKEAAAEFLSHKRVAVTGVSRTPGSHGSNVVYKRLRGRGYDVFAVNPNADRVEDDPAYHDLRSIPGGVTTLFLIFRCVRVRQEILLFVVSSYSPSRNPGFFRDL